MHDPAVAQIDLGRFDQPFAGVGVPGLQSADEQQIDEQVDVVGRGLASDPEAAREVGGVEDAALLVGQHGPESAQGFGSDARPELCDVAFEIRADEITAPAQAARLVGGKQAIGKSAAHPQRIAGDSGGADLQDVEGAELQTGDPPGQRLARLLHQLQAG